MFISTGEWMPLVLVIDWIAISVNSGAKLLTSASCVTEGTKGAGYPLFFNFSQSIPRNQG